jgi:hypothetical protein
MRKGAQIMSSDPARHPDLEAAPGEARTGDLRQSDSPDLRRILHSIGAAAYEWDLASDRISWDAGAASVLGFANFEALRTGRAIAACLAHDSESAPHEVIARAVAMDAGAGAPFRIRYGLRSPDRPRDAPVWVEDTGRWFAGSDGRPSHVHGLIRVVTDGYRRDQSRHGRDAQTLVQSAEAALRVARPPGAPPFSLCESAPAQSEIRASEKEVSDAIAMALNAGRIVIALQPLVWGASGVPASYEALMRLIRPDGALALPGAILPIAEKSGLIQFIDRRVLDLALLKLREDANLRLAVNVSGLTLHDAEFYDHLNSSLDPCPEVARRLTMN